MEIEHPELKTRKRRHPKRKNVKKRSLRRLVIPIFEESDNDEFGAGGTDDEDGERDVGRTSVVYDVQRQRAGQFTALIELVRSHRQSVRVQQQQNSNNNNSNVAQEKEDEGMEEAVDVEEFENASAEPKETEETSEEDKHMEEASASSTSIAEQRKKIPKREKFDSGIGDEIENGKGLSSDSDRDEDAAFMDVDSDSDFSDPFTLNGKRAHGNGEKVHSQGEDNGSRSRDNHRSLGERRARTRNLAEEAVIWKRLTFAADEESDEKSEEEMQDAVEMNNTPETDSYTTYMRSKIQALPLPPSLKAYINLYREF